MPEPARVLKLKSTNGPKPLRLTRGKLVRTNISEGLRSTVRPAIDRNGNLVSNLSIVQLRQKGSIAFILKKLIGLKKPINELLQLGFKPSELYRAGVTVRDIADILEHMDVSQKAKLGLSKKAVVQDLRAAGVTLEMISEAFAGLESKSQLAKIKEYEDVKVSELEPQNSNLILTLGRFIYGRYGDRINSEAVNRLMTVIKLKFRVDDRFIERIATYDAKKLTVEQQAELDILKKVINGLRANLDRNLRMADKYLYDDLKGLGLESADFKYYDGLKRGFKNSRASRFTTDNLKQLMDMLSKTTLDRRSKLKLLREFVAKFDLELKDIIQTLVTSYYPNLLVKKNIDNLARNTIITLADAYGVEKVYNELLAAQKGIGFGDYLVLILDLLLALDYSSLNKTMISTMRDNFYRQFGHTLSLPQPLLEQYVNLELSDFLKQNRLLDGQTKLLFEKAITSRGRILVADQRQRAKMIFPLSLFVAHLLEIPKLKQTSNLNIIKDYLARKFGKDMIDVLFSHVRGSDNT